MGPPLQLRVWRMPCLRVMFYLVYCNTLFYLSFLVFLKQNYDLGLGFRFSLSADLVLPFGSSKIDFKNSIKDCVSRAIHWP